MACIQKKDIRINKNTSMFIKYLNIILLENVSVFFQKLKMRTQCNQRDFIYTPFY